MNGRRGFTLTEMLIVLALIVILAALSLPSVMEMYGEYVATAAADSVQAAWAEARGRAIDDGRPYRFAILDGMGNYRVAPDSPEFWSGSGAGGGEGENPPLILQGALTRGIRFSHPDTLGQDTASLAGDTAMADGDVSPEMFTPVVSFLPDGTATADVEIVIQARTSAPLLLRLRGMTGGVTIVRLRMDGTPR